MLDEDAKRLELAKRYLSRRGYELPAAHDGVEALPLAWEDEPDFASMSQTDSGNRTRGQSAAHIWVQHPHTCPCCRGAYVEVEVMEGTDGVLIRPDTKQVWSHISLVQGNLVMVVEAANNGVTIYLSPYHGPKVR